MAKESGRESIRQLRKKVMFSCRIMGDRGVTRGSFGHVSARVSEFVPGIRIVLKAKQILD